MIVPNFVQIGQGVAEIRPFFDFSRWRPSAILNFKTLEILTVHTFLRVKMRHRTEFCADRSNRCGDMAVFVFSRWRPSAILDFYFNCPHPSGGQNASPCQILCKSVKALLRYGRFPFFKMDLLYACLDHPRSVFWWSLSLCKIWFESVQ